MALPSSRDFTATPLAPLPSASYNNVQDAIIAHNALLHGGAGSAVFANPVQLLGGVNGLVQASGKITSGGNVELLGDVLAGGIVNANIGITSSGNIQAGANLTANGNCTVNGSVTGADLKHTSVHNRNISAAIGIPEVGGSWGLVVDVAGGVGAGVYYLRASAGDATHLVIPIDVEEGETIASWSIDMQNDSADHTMNAALMRSNAASWSTINVLSALLATGRATQTNAALGHAVVAGESYCVKINNVASATANAFRVYKIKIGVTRV